MLSGEILFIPPDELADKKSRKVAGRQPKTDPSLVDRKIRHISPSGFLRFACLVPISGVLLCIGPITSTR